MAGCSAAGDTAGMEVAQSRDRVPNTTANNSTVPHTTIITGSCDTGTGPVTDAGALNPIPLSRGNDTGPHPTQTSRSRNPFYNARPDAQVALLIDLARVNSLAGSSRARNPFHNAGPDAEIAVLIDLPRINSLAGRSTTNTGPGSTAGGYDIGSSATTNPIIDP